MRTLCGLIVVALLLALPAAVLAATYDLIGGNPKNGVYKVGKVEVTDDGSNLIIQYSVDDPWAWDLTATHVQVVGPVDADGDGEIEQSEIDAALDQVPHTKGGPTPGQFDYDESSPQYQGGGRYVIPHPGDHVIILAHGVACENLTGPMPPWLPETVEICVRLWQDEAALQIKMGDVIYGGYCADRDSLITIGGLGNEWTYCYTADVFSSYDDPASLPLIDYPEYLPQVNYMLNQDYVGQTCPPDPDASGVFTYADVQMAKWALLEGDVSASFPIIPDGYDDQGRVGWLIEDALANGEDYIPGCGDKIDILLYPIDPDTGEYLQPLEILIPVECGGCDTVWAGTVITLDPPDVDYPYPGKNWALYVIYPPLPPDGAPPRMSLDSSVTTTWGSIKNR